MSVSIGRTSLAAETPTVKVGDPAPDFTLTSHTGEEYHLADKRDRNVVIAFYPFAFSGT
jgi:peroxiredoxin (alkyl hydroperoxide reductase subunit C)